MVFARIAAVLLALASSAFSADTKQSHQRDSKATQPCITRVTKGNLGAVSETILAKAKAADYISYSVTTTGGQFPGNEHESFWDVASVLSKIRVVVHTFALVEVGMTLFTYSPGQKKFEADAFSFLVLPAHPSKVLAADISTLRLLRQKGLDLGALIEDALPLYDSPGLESDLKSTALSDADRHLLVQAADMNAAAFFRSIIDLKRPAIFFNGLHTVFFLASSLLYVRDANMADFKTMMATKLVQRSLFGATQLSEFLCSHPSIFGGPPPSGNVLVQLPLDSASCSEGNARYLFTSVCSTFPSFIDVQVLHASGSTAEGVYASLPPDRIPVVPAIPCESPLSAGHSSYLAGSIFANAVARFSEQYPQQRLSLSDCLRYIMKRPYCQAFLFKNRHMNNGIRFDVKYEGSNTKCACPDCITTDKARQTL